VDQNTVPVSRFTSPGVRTAETEEGGGAGQRAQAVGAEVRGGLSGPHCGEFMGRLGFSAQTQVRFSIYSFLFYFNFRFPNQIQIPLLNLNSPSAKSNTNVNIISTVYYIIIYFLWNLFMEGINGFY
jgi:hypothetical protein